MICTCGNYIEQTKDGWRHVSSGANHDPEPWLDITEQDINSAFRFWITLYPDKQKAIEDISKCLDNPYLQMKLGPESKLDWKKIINGNMDYFLIEDAGIIIRLKDDLPLIPVKRSVENLKIILLVASIVNTIFGVLNVVKYVF